MYKVRAYQAFDGSGVYEAEGQLYFVTSPYSSSQTRIITLQQLHYLHRQLDYTMVEVNYDSFAQVKDYFTAQAKAWVNPHGNVSVDESAFLKGLSSLSEENLLGILHNLQTEQLAAGKAQELRVALDRFWKISKVTSSDRLREALRKLEADVAILLAPLDRIQNSPPTSIFRNLSSRYPNVQMRGALLNPVAA